MKVTLDKFGRIVIPKVVRDMLGLEAGTVLHVETTKRTDGEEVVSLHPERDDTVLKRKDGILVHTGKADHPIDSVEDIRRIRQDSALKYAGNMGIAAD